MTDRPMLFKDCEGTGYTVHDLGDRVACAMCGRDVPVETIMTSEGGVVAKIARWHQRQDVIAMLDRGDFG